MPALINPTKLVGFSSHVPILVKLVEATSGPVVELGIGTYSTLLLHTMCQATGRKLVSCEGDLGYYERFKDLNNDFHSVVFIEDWEKFEVDQSGLWSVVLIDHAPGYRRSIDALKFVNVAEYIVMHDSELRWEKKYRYSRVYRKCKYWVNIDRYFPNTSVASNFCDVSWLKNV